MNAWHLRTVFGWFPSIREAPPGHVPNVVRTIGATAMVRRFDVSVAITRLMPTSSALGTSDIGPLRHSAAYCRRGYKRPKYSEKFSDGQSAFAADTRVKAKAPEPPPSPWDFAYGSALMSD